VCGVGQFARQAFANQSGRALQGAHLGGHADVDFLDAEDRVGRAITHVGAADQVNASGEDFAFTFQNGEPRLGRGINPLERSA